MIKKKDKGGGEEGKEALQRLPCPYRPLPASILRNTRLLGSSYGEYVITTELDSLLCESLSRVVGIHKAYEIIESIKRLTGMSPAEVLVNNPRDFVTAFERSITSLPERILHEVFKVLSYMVGVGEEPPDVANISEFTRFIEKIIQVIVDTKAKYFSRVVNDNISGR
ncbi:MAG: hypothetical protein DRO14_04210 [Thermoprotei archaeon]|nr:MAG: hypothetical protein DRO14_04210 [Thermoprotei archaeon]